MRSLKAKLRQPQLNFASLNIRGLKGLRMNEENKLICISIMMRQNKWAIIALQETHKCMDTMLALEKANGRFWCFANEGTSNSTGTGYIVLKDMFSKDISKDHFTYKILIKGRLDSLSFA